MTNWDRRFLALAQHISKWSKDTSTKCGAVIVRPDKTIASLGFNGFPRLMEDRAELIENRMQKLERIIHAEMNAILFLRGENVTSRHTLYTWPLLPCHRCAVHVIQAGIGRVVAPVCTIDRWQDSIEKSMAFFKEARVEVLEVKDEDGKSSSVDGSDLSDSRDMQPGGASKGRGAIPAAAEGLPARDLRQAGELLLGGSSGL